jgi:uncharacterized membrane protein YagU involved in acid resistance
MNRQLAGSISGFAATFPMTAVMVALKKTLPPEHQQPLPPRQITENAAQQAGVDQHLDEADDTTAAAVAHFAYGALAGIGYVPMAGKSGLPPVAEGTLYGLAVWSGSYLGVLPATGLHKSAVKEPATRNAVMIAAHVVWGGALGLMFNVLAGRNKNATAPESYGVFE